MEKERYAMYFIKISNFLNLTKGFNTIRLFKSQEVFSWNLGKLILNFIYDPCGTAEN